MGITDSVSQLRDHLEHSSLSSDQKIGMLKQLFMLLIVEETEATKVQFTSLFARLSFIISSRAITAKESYILHSFRKALQDASDLISTEEVGEVAVDILIKYINNEQPILSNTQKVYDLLTRDKPYQNIKFLRQAKALLTTIDVDSWRLQARLAEEPFDQVTVDINRPDRNDDLIQQISILAEESLLPIVVNFIDIEIDREGLYYPSSIVFEPDYLFDVTAIAECFGPFANHQTGYLLRKFLKREITKPILVGNIANYFLDQLVYNPDSSFQDFINKLFAIDPLSFSLMSDQDVKEMLVLLERHFNHIKGVVCRRFDSLGIDADRCHVEPAFYSSKYGIQGRLDLFHRADDTSNIIELKSGSAYRPNSYGLANNHFHQTLLYDMLIESVYGHQLKRNNFILYSKESKDHLRFAPALKTEQREAIKERNQLYLHDRILLESDDFIAYYHGYAKEQKSAIKGFQKKHFDEFLTSMKDLDDVERSYVTELLQVVLRELYINKVGDPGKDQSSGLAGLWLKTLESKREQFNILDFLIISAIDSNERDTIIRLSFSDRSNPLSNFRLGDLGILYPHIDHGIGMLRHQVFKLTILDINPTYITVRLRSHQENLDHFNSHEFWHIEHDTLDNGYNEMSRSIYEFASSEKSNRDLLLGRKEPEQYEVWPHSCSHQLTEEQSQIFKEIISAKDYYLLWGPPGTGKTSIMLREIAHHYITHERDRVLLLAYTNRAVDEICEALYSISPIPSFIRIGSRYSTGEKYKPHLLENIIGDIKSRKELRELLIGKQVFVGTVASLMGKTSLFSLIKFDIAIIDEASQLLEASLIGLLSRVRKWILIGDHLQLPAVVRQDRSHALVRSMKLQAIGYQNFTMSFFERLYLRARLCGWEHCIGQLTFQGRMHLDIMSFANAQFYQGNLKVLPTISRLSAKQVPPYLAGATRLSFVRSKADLSSESVKVNNHEAVLVCQLCQQIVSNYKKYNIPITPMTLGVITPYRAQIAAIKKYLSERLPEWASFITVDTVERYQGGARDIIIMSTCINYSFQLKSLVSLSEDGVDRKLNVALTRAREQFILIGNPILLEQQDTYAALIARSGLIDI